MSDEIRDDEQQSEVDTKEILQSIKLNDKEPDKEKTKNKVETVIVERDADSVVEDEELTKQLHAEFSSFLETKTELIEDLGVKDTIPTGIDLVDAILGGGFVIGALGIIVGQPGSGKSMLAMQTLAQGQRKFKGKMLGGFLDSEHATTSQRLWNLGVRYPRLKPYADTTVEKVFKYIEGLSVFKHEKKIIETPSMVVWDSIANTLSQKELETDDPNTVIGYKARLLSILIPKYVSQCAKHNICFLAVNQLRDVLKLDRFAPPKDLKFMSASKDMPGGNILKYNAFQLVEIKVKSAITPTSTEKSENYGFEGIIVNIKCVKNKLFPPNVEVPVVGSFVTGFSNFWTNYNFLKTTKRLNAGAWNYLVSYPDKKFRTKDAPKLYKDDPKFKEKFDEASAEAIDTEIIKKYNPDVI
ncbi:MAG: ATPase domain-containing protein [Candidatus Thorarchaeota archaeon]